MNKKLNLLALALVMLSSAVMASTQLKLNLENGKTCKVKTKTAQTITMNMNGMDMNTEMSMESSISFSVTAVKEDTFEMDVLFEQIVNKIDMPGRSMTMSSAAPGDPSKPEEVMNTVFFILSQNTLKVIMSSSGRVIDITNAKEITEKALAAFDSVPPAMQMQMKPMAEGALGKANLKSMIEAITAYFPDKNSTNNQNWESNISISANGMELVSKSKYKIKKTEGSNIVLAAESTIEPAGNGKMTANGMEVAYEMRGMGQSELTIDALTGWIIKGNGRMRTKGSITAGGMNMPMEIESKTEFVEIK